MPGSPRMKWFHLQTNPYPSTFTKKFLIEADYLGAVTLAKEMDVKLNIKSQTLERKHEALNMNQACNAKSTKLGEKGETGKWCFLQLKTKMFRLFLSQKKFYSPIDSWNFCIWFKNIHVIMTWGAIRMQ